MGTYFHIDGSKYEGQWYDDKQDGEGKFLMAINNLILSYIY